MPIHEEELKIRARETAKFLKKYDDLADADVIAKKEKLVHAQTINRLILHYGRFRVLTTCLL